MHIAVNLIFKNCLQSVGMLKNIIAFHTLANSAVERTAAGGSEGQKITFNVIKQRLSDLLYKITSQKFEDPSEGEDAIKYAPSSLLRLSHSQMTAEH